MIARLHGWMVLHPSSFVALYLKGTVSREFMKISHFTKCNMMVFKSLAK
jgi:hypothetical protein